MSNKRMAGDALNDPNYAARLKLSEDPAKAKERASMASGYDVSGYSDKEISMAMKGSSFGDEDYARLTGGSIGGDDPAPEAEAPAPEAPAADPQPSVDIDFGSDDPVMGLPKPPSGFIPDMRGPAQNIYQNNDINSSVVGDGNTVTNNQDNSINGYSGSGDWKKAWMQDYFA